MGNKGLEYGRSYANSGLKPHAKSFENLSKDIFFCQFAQEILRHANPMPLVKDVIMNMTEIASHLFTEDNLEFAVHGSPDQFPLIQLKLEMLVNSIKNENSRFGTKSPIIDPKEFVKPSYFQTFFKTPLAVNDCIESFVGPTYANIEDYGAGLVLSEIMSQ